MANTYTLGMSKLTEDHTDATPANFINWVLEPDIQTMLWQTEITYNVDDDFVSNITGTEFSGVGYSRYANSAQTIAANDAANRVEYDADDANWTALGSGEVIEAANVIRAEGADTANELLSYYNFNFTTVGGDVTIQWAAEGMFVLNT